MIKLFEEYLSEHSIESVRHRALEIKLNLVYQSPNHFTFSYKGTSRKPYEINVFSSTKDVRTTCDCPYDYGGICKHEVAALNYLIGLKPPTKKNITKINKTKNNSKKRGEIQLTNHILRYEAIEKLEGKQIKDWNHHLFSKIEEIKVGEIKTSCSTWDTYNKKQQSYIYDHEQGILTTKCDCSGSFQKKICNHIINGLYEIEDVIGENAFSPRFLDDQIEYYLEPFGMTLEDDYQKYFAFSLAPDGLKVDEIVKNILPINDLIEKAFTVNIIKDENKYLINKTGRKFDYEYGLGGCFNVLKKRKNKVIIEFFPFSGKFKKNTKELFSKFEQLTSYNFFEKLKEIDSDHHFPLQSMLHTYHEIDEYLDRSVFDNYRTCYLSLKELLNSDFKYPIFIKKEKDTLVKKNLTQLRVSEQELDLSFQLTENEEFVVLKPKFKIEGKSYQINSSQFTLTPFFCIFKETIYFYKNLLIFGQILKFNDRADLKFFANQKENIYKTLIEPLSKHFEIDTKKVFKTVKNKFKDENLKKQLFIKDFEGELVVFKLGVQYDGKLALLNEKSNFYDEKTHTITERNHVFEDDFLEEFKELHPDFEQQEKLFTLTPFQLIEDQWLIKSTQKLEQSGVEILGAKDLKSFKYNIHKPTLRLNLNSGTDWFDIDIEVKFGNQVVSLKDIKKAVIKKSNYVTLSDGTLGILPESWLKKFSGYFKSGDVKNDKVRISNYQFNIVDDLYEHFEETPDFLQQLYNKKQQLQNLKNITETTIPNHVNATLRPYQKEALNWLNFLDENNLGGCLADDMGLGKTLQIITFFAHLKDKKNINHPHLVVVPTSLIFNWEKEVEKFCPTLKICKYTGVNRSKLFSKFGEFDIILTTYGSVLNDIEKLKGQEFNYIVLDESQAIKNPNSKRYKAVRLLNAENRLALTGTPIENNTFDLYAQMNFLNPGLLGSMNHFKKEFSDEIDKDKNEDTSNLLSKIIQPFLLRRTKKQVATELPEKVESVLYCEMGTEQRKVYNAFKDKYRDYLLNKIDENGVAKSQMYVLEGLTKLRQICNSPELLNEEEDYGKSSIKLDILIDNLKSKISNHKVLVFSQFTSMLSLIKDRLENESIEYEYLDGQTRKREAKVENFQSNENLRVFLISLKAGGVGLNLTAADYVFLVDPWWNPAVENQAIDRSYRIGQKKKVMAYKMICKDSIEEKIINLQKSKIQVSDAVVQVDNVKKSFDVDEIKELFN